MFVASRRLFPLSDPKPPVVLVSSDTWTTLTPPEIGDLLRTSTNTPPNPGSYRKFRLRCSYSDIMPGLKKPQLQLKFQPGPSNPFPTGLTPAVLTLPRASTITSLCYSSETEWFTLGQGSVLDFDGQLDKSAVLVARYTNVSGSTGLQATLYEVVMECWDFSSPNASSSVAVIHESTLKWSRPICTPPSNTQALPLLFTSGHTSTKDFSWQHDIFMKDVPIPAGFTRSFTMRAIIAASSTRAVFGVRLISVTDGSTKGQWNFQTDKVLDAGTPVQKTVQSNQEVTPPSLDLKETYLSVTFFVPLNETATGVLYGLVLEAHDKSSQLSPRSIKSINRSVSLSGSYPTVPADGSSLSLGKFRELFTHNATILAVDSLRDFYMRLSWYRSTVSTAATKLILRMTNLVDPRDFHDFELKFPAASSISQNVYQEFAISAPLEFGDGRAPSIPNSDWVISVHLDVASPGLVVQLAEAALEARDRPVADIHLPTTQVCSLPFIANVVNLPQSSGLNFGLAPFTICVWVSSTPSYYQTHFTDEDSSIHTFLQHGNTYSLAITDNGDLYATVRDTNGPVTVTMPGPGPQIENEWHYLTLVWDGSEVKLGIDYDLQTTGTPTTSLLVADNVGTSLGSSNFAGSIRSITFWAKAFTKADIRKNMYNPPTTTSSLIAHVEISPTLLINAPGAPELNSFSLPTITAVLIESYGLVTGSKGCACMDADDIFHMNPSSTFTLEAWICPGSIAGTSVIAGKFNSLTSGYGLMVQDGNLVSLWGTRTVTSTTSLTVDTWLHVATSLGFSGNEAVLTIYLNGVPESSQKFSSSETSIDNAATVFTAGGFCDMSGLVPVVANSFAGTIDEVRLWSVCRQSKEIRPLMYTCPASDAPSIIANWTFEGSRTGDHFVPTLHGNAEIVYYNRLVRIGDLPILGANPLLGPGPPSSTVLEPQLDVRPDDLTSRHMPGPDSALDDNTVRIWVDFIFDLVFISLDALIGIDAIEVETLRPILLILWGMDAARTILAKFQNADLSFLEGLKEGDPIPISRQPFDHPRPSGEITDATTLIEIVAEFLMMMEEKKLVRPVLEVIPSVSFSATVKFLAKLWLPAVGLVWLGVNLLIAAYRFGVAVDKFKQRLKENEEENSRPGLQLTLATEPVFGRRVPLRVGGAAQIFSVRLNPPYKKSSLTVYFQNKSTSVLNTSVSQLVFPANSSVALPFTVSARSLHTGIAQSRIHVYTSLTSSAGGSDILFDEREQDLTITPDECTLSVDDATESVNLKVSFKAILDSTTSATAVISDGTLPDEDPDPHKKLQFDGADTKTLTFARQSAWSHSSGEQSVNVKLVDKTSIDSPAKGDERSTIPIELRKRPRCDYSNNGEGTKKGRIQLAGTHTTKIAMVSASNGDCYVVTDQFGTTGTPVNMLIDGGRGNTWARSLQSTLTGLGITSLDFLMVSHVDADHVDGLLYMVNDDVGRPSQITTLLMNDPAGHITTPIGNNSISADEATPPDIQTFIRKSEYESHLRDDLISIRGSFNKRQGNELYQKLTAAYPTMVSKAPRGLGPAVSDISRRDITTFPGLDVEFFGPSKANVQAFRATDSDDSVKNNRASTIMVLRTNTNFSDTFSALFTGDAWDNMEKRFTDIRGLGSPSAADHFTVIKMPHHGSPVSEDVAFYNAYTANYYLVSTKWRPNWGHPSAELISAACLACQSKGYSPVFITTSSWQSSGIQTGLYPQIEQVLTRTNSKMYFFQDSTLSIALQFRDGVLLDGWQTDLIERP